MNEPCPKCFGTGTKICGACDRPGVICRKCRGTGGVRITYGNGKILAHLFDNWERIKDLSAPEIYYELLGLGLYSKTGAMSDYCMSIGGYKKRIRSYYASKESS